MVHHDDAERHCNALELPGGTRTQEFITGEGTGERLFTQQWLPHQPPKALIFLCHGYADHTSWIFGERVGGYFLSLGCAVFAIDYVGHGQSGGTFVYIKSWDAMCKDVDAHYTKVKQRHPELKAFLVGESMGGAVALTLAHRRPALADGLVLLAPMCKIADEMMPSKPMVTIMKGLAHIAPFWKVVPQDGDILDKCVRDPVGLEHARRNPIRYMDKPRLATANQLLAATQMVNASIPEITHPLLILHGEADRVTAPEASKDLYERSKSTDKALKTYPESFHCLFMEPEPNYSQVRADVKEWLEAHLQSPQ